MSKSKPKQITPAKPREVRVQVEEVPAMCPKCKTTGRTGYESIKHRKISGTKRDGTPFNLVRWLNCKCKGCGQCLRVQRFENLTVDALAAIQ